MKKGEVVKIYQKPLSEEDFEGRARLVKHLPEMDLHDMEFWRVEFTNEPGAYYDRFIKK